MAKNKKKNLQKLVNKKQLLQQIGQSVELPPLPVVTHSQPELASPVGEQPELIEHSYVRDEIRRTLMGVGLVMILLATAVIVSDKTMSFQTFGNWLYRVLRLSTS